MTREEREMSQAQVGALFGISATAVGKIEAGKSAPRFESLLTWIYWLFPEMEQGKAEQSAEQSSWCSPQ